MLKFSSSRKFPAAALAAVVALAVAGAASAQIGIGPFSANPVPPTVTSLPPRTPPTPTIDNSNSVIQALTALDWQTINTNGVLPGGCAAISGVRYCTPHVVIDGRQASDVQIIGNLVGLTTSPGGRNSQPAQYAPGSLAATHAAVSEVVLASLLLDQANADGIAASTADATKVTQSLLANYQRTDPAQANILPPGVDAKTFFTAPQIVEGYRQALSIANERRKIETAAGITQPSGPQTRPDSAVAQHQREALSAFLAQHISQHSITVNGAQPTFDVEASLPATP